MKYISVIVMFVVSCAISHAEVTLVTKHISEYTIVIPENAQPAEIRAAQELQRYLKEISGTELPIVNDTGRIPSQAILLGNIRNSPLKIDRTKLGADGFCIETSLDKIIIAGGSPRGTLYGVYQFLEDYLGCRWFSDKESRVPKKETIVLPDIHRTVIPPLEYREAYYVEAETPDWAARNRINGSVPKLDAAHGGKIIYVPGYFVHTFFSLVPPEKYFETHPEYFSLVNGKRIKNGQLCLSNPDVFKIAITGVKEVLRKNPDANIISVSQMDGSGPCECEKCREITVREGTESGPILQFVNAIADAVAKEFPNVSIDTLAYQYSRNPPLHLKPRENVIIRYCTIEACCSHPIGTCPENVSLKNDLEEWAKIAPRIYVWYYTANFGHFYAPHPNLYTISPDFRFFVRNNVKGIFAQGSWAIGAGGGEFAELRSYLLARLLWDPKTDTNNLIKEFLDAYYGKAAEPIGKYISLLHNRITDVPDFHLKIGSPPNNPYLTPEFLQEAEKLFQEAEDCVKNENGDMQLRVAIAHLPVMYARLMTGVLNEKDKRASALSFAETGRKAGYILINEGGLTFANFIKQFTCDRPAPRYPGGIVAGVYDFGLARPWPCEPWWVKIVDDATASLGKATYQPNKGGEWSVQWHPGKERGTLFKPDVRYRAILTVKVRKNDDTGKAFSAGVYDDANKKHLLNVTVDAVTMRNDAWQEIVIGELTPFEENLTFWVAPVDNEAHVPDIFVDKWELVPVEERK
ncbi:MAG: DUF4838 domain-containing protein [Candidatus Omnitrophota bacterium]